MVQARDAFIALNVTIISAYKHWTEFRWGTSLSFSRAFCNFFRYFHTTREAIVVTSLEHRSTLWFWLFVASLLTQADILIGSSVEEMGNQSKAGLCDTRTNPIGPY